ncbi:MAG: DNA mismatch repair endonuclease MutL [Bacillota bacterium]|nr:DNA mismatch repair endonuclease MutL [Bacillota bacterium]
MGRINILDKHVAELIAAGEVVERPASVIKELLENSIDAGATNITVEIKNGGISFMRVTDNGLGIAREDVAKAFLRHATSKVLLEEDLDKISTLGFRGEALASICAVSHVELITKFGEDIAGTKYTISGGVEEGIEDAGCSGGTTIIIRDLFYNIPARMKFLKKDISEANAVAGVVDRIALSHPEVAFVFIRDGKQVLNTPGDGKLMSSVYSVLGREFATGLISVDYELNGVIVNGYISKPQSARPNRNMQHFFLNGRYVKSRTAMAAIEEACKGSVMVGKFPSCVLNINMPYNLVDVNVHPAKIEVRFTNERPVFDAVYHAIKTALQQENNHTVSLSHVSADFKQKTENKKSMFSFDKLIPNIKKESKETQPIVFIPPNKPYEPNFVSDNIAKKDIFKINKIDSEPASNITILSDKRDTKDAAEILETTKIEKFEKPKNEKPFDNMLFSKYIGEAFNTYIFVEISSDKLLVIDKHAAHERLIYEKLKKENGKLSAQMLLEPVIVTLSKAEYDAVLQNSDLLYDTGFEVSDFGSGNIAVRSAPQVLKNDDISNALIEIAGYLLENKNDTNTEKMDWVFHNTACRAAVKGGDINSRDELIHLAVELQNDPSIRYCPHGRPISVVIHKRDLEKQFGRV